MLLWRVEGILEMTVRTAEDGTDYTRVRRLSPDTSALPVYGLHALLR